MGLHSDRSKMFPTSKTFVSIGSEGNHEYAFTQLTTKCKNYPGKKETVKAKVTSAEALTLLRWVPLHARRIGHRCCLVQDALKGKFPNILMC